MKIDKNNHKNYVIDMCPKCGGRRVTKWFMVPDGYDDVDWDCEEICENCDNLRDDFDKQMLKDIDELEQEKMYYINNLEENG